MSGGRGYLGSAIGRRFRAGRWQVADLSPRGEYPCDVTNVRHVRAALREIRARFGAIDACIHAASAPLVRKHLLDLSAEEFRVQVSVAAEGAFNLFKETRSVMNTGGAFIGITTTALRPGRLEPSGSYVPAKYALLGILRVLSQECASARVYAIAPGFLPGGLNKDLPENVRAFLASKMTPPSALEDIADVAYELAEGGGDISPGSVVYMPQKDVERL